MSVGLKSWESLRGLGDATRSSNRVRPFYGYECKRTNKCRKYGRDLFAGISVDAIRERVQHSGASGLSGRNNGDSRVSDDRKRGSATVRPERLRKLSLASLHRLRI